MKLTYDIDKLEVYGTDIGGKVFKRIRIFVWSYRLMKGIGKVKLDKKEKAFTIKCKNKADFKHLYDSITYAFQESKRKGLVPNLQIQELKKDSDALNIDEKKRLSKGFGLASNKLRGGSAK